jgi:UDP-2-acetamido-3-amino-2,3-dideoxy-glucuronate N-acetyltransferase
MMHDVRRRTMTTHIHPTAEISSQAIIGDGCRIWNWVQIRAGVRVGVECVIGSGVYVDADVQIGDRCKIQNGVALYAGVALGNGVFVGPHVCFTNDMFPRAVNPDGTLKSGADWEIVKTQIEDGASIGANSTIRCGIVVGRWAMIGAGAMVTKSVPAHGLVLGNPARLAGYVGRCGHPLQIDPFDSSIGRCERCGEVVTGLGSAEPRVSTRESA